MTTIRPAVPRDFEAYARLHGELRVPEPLPTLERFAEELVPTISVSCDPTGAVTGYVIWRRYGPLAHVVNVVVDAAVRGQRIGERLLEHVRGQARAAGCTRWYLNVKRENAPALRLYERCGFRQELESFAMKIDWAKLPRLDVRERLADPSEDAAIAARFPVAPLERLANFRARGTFKPVTLRGDADALLGFAAFDPSFPGAATFCAASPELAASLLEAMRHHADPTIDYVRVMIEGDRPLTERVLAMGAELTFEMLWLSAALDSGT
jgi:GNAT superfamily N-acetyltransferase